MTEAERKLLLALAWMSAQYLESKDGDLDSLCMSAGEEALRVLAEHGLVEITHGGRCGRWTEAGTHLLNSS